MGIYLNPGNSGFTGIRNDIYVDKTGLIALANVTELTGNKFKIAQNTGFLQSFIFFNLNLTYITS